MNNNISQDNNLASKGGFLDMIKNPNHYPERDRTPDRISAPASASVRRVTSDTFVPKPAPVQRTQTIPEPQSIPKSPSNGNAYGSNTKPNFTNYTNNVGLGNWNPSNADVSPSQRNLNYPQRAFSIPASAKEDLSPRSGYYPEVPQPHRRQTTETEKKELPKTSAAATKKKEDNNWHRLANFIKLILIILIIIMSGLLLRSIFDYYKPLPYCDGYYQEKHCRACPDGSLCFGGKIKSSDEQSNNQIDILKKNMYDEITYLLMRRRGRVDCHELPETDLRISVADLEDEIKNINKAYEDTFRGFKTMLGNERYSKDFDKYDIQYVYQDFTNSYIKLKGEGSIKSINCKFKEALLQKEMLSIIIGVTLLVVLLVFLKNRSKNREIGEKIYRQLKELVRNRELAKAAAVDELAENLKINKSKIESLWRVVECERKKEGIVHTIKKMEHGVEKDYYHIFNKQQYQISP